ncbi:MAG: glycosyltransferase family 39 protein [Solirubrobacteraceae bacterium]
MATHATPATADAYLDRPRSSQVGPSDESTKLVAGWSMAQTWAAVAALTAAGIALRLLIVRGIWVDEAISIHQAHMSLSGMLANLRTTDNHPPLYFLLLWVNVRVLGYNELAVHVPTIIAGTLLIPALFITGRELFDRRTGLFAAALASVAPLLIWYSQEARPYAFFMLFATLAVWAQARVLSDGAIRYWIAYGGLTIALLYTHYFSVLPIAIQQLAFIVAVWNRTRRNEPVKQFLTAYWITWIAIAVALAPLVPYIHQQFLHDQVAGTGFDGAPSAGAASTALPQTSHPNVYALIANFVWAIWGYHANSTMLRLAALWPLLMLLALTLLGRGRSRRTLLVLALAIVPALLLMAVGFKKRDLFEVRYFSGAVPMLILLTARTVVAASARRLPVLLVGAALMVTVLLGTADQQMSGNNPRDYPFRDALHNLNAHARPGATLMYAPNYLQDVIEYYSPHVRAVALGAHKPQIPAHGQVFVLGSFFDQPGFASEVGNARAAVKQAHRRLVGTQKLEKVYMWEYR